MCHIYGCFQQAYLDFEVPSIELRIMNPGQRSETSLENQRVDCFSFAGSGYNFSALLLQQECFPKCFV